MTDHTPVTLITGGSTGMGAAAARHLLELGHCVTVTARREERLKAFRASVGDPANLLTISGDAADYDAVAEAVDTTVKTFGRLDNVVANAGHATHDQVADGDPRGWRDMVLTNVLGPALLVRASVDHLRETRGRIVMVGSVAGHIFGAGNIYGSTKWAVHGLAENTRRQVTGDGIGVTLIEPGRTETPFWETLELEGFTTDGFLSADEVAASIVWALTQPPGVDVNTVVIRPIGQPV
jgi:NADP-dependent 3-hydroxy acid dehydrogenase YdfG